MQIGWAFIVTAMVLAVTALSAGFAGWFFWLLQTAAIALALVGYAVLRLTTSQLLPIQNDSIVSPRTAKTPPQPTLDASQPTPREVGTKVSGWIGEEKPVRTALEPVRLPEERPKEAPHLIKPQELIRKEVYDSRARGIGEITDFLLDPSGSWRVVVKRDDRTLTLSADEVSVVGDIVLLKRRTEDILVKEQEQRVAPSKVCSACGRQNPPKNNFCQGCGRPLG